MEGLTQFMPNVLALLLKLCEAPDKPLLRSISCWCTSRYAFWICHQQNPNRENVVKLVLTALLSRMMDRNKRVQEAACSAFATFEETALLQMVPYLDDIVSTLVRCFQYYQAKNLLILYDAVGTLANSVHGELDKPQYIQALCGPLMAKFDSVADNDRSTVALFECLGTLVQRIGASLLPIVPKLIDRCSRVVVTGSQQAQRWLQNPNEFEKPDREAMAASIDLLAGIVEGLGPRVKEVLAQTNFIQIVPEVLKDTALNVKQSAFALVGDSAKICPEYLHPFLPQVLPLCAAALRANTSASVSNNAAWSIGEICVQVRHEGMAPYLDDIVQALASVLARGHGPQQLMTNVSITLGRLATVSGPAMGKHFEGFAKQWCHVMAATPPDLEKCKAFHGMISMLKANPQACLNCLLELCRVACSLSQVQPNMCTPAVQELIPIFKDILMSYKNLLGANWAQAYGTFPPYVKQRLQQIYEITA